MDISLNRHRRHNKKNRKSRRNVNPFQWVQKSFKDFQHRKYFENSDTRQVELPDAVVRQLNLPHKRAHITKDGKLVQDGTEIPITKM